MKDDRQSPTIAQAATTAPACAGRSMTTAAQDARRMAAPTLRHVLERPSKRWPSRRTRPASIGKAKRAPNMRLQTTGTELAALMRIRLWRIWQRMKGHLRLRAAALLRSALSLDNTPVTASPPTSVDTLELTDQTDRSRGTLGRVAPERTYGGRLLEPDHCVELVRQMGVKIVAHTLALRPVYHADRTLEPARRQSAANA